MPTQTELIRRFETASLPELIRVIHRPGKEEAAALITWLGPERYKRLRDETLTPRKRGEARPPRKNVVVLHGIMGAEITVRNGNDSDLVWVHIPRLVGGGISRLKMKADGNPETDSFSSDLMRKYYLEMLVGLARDHEVVPFHYDWRRDLKHSAARLEETVNRHFAPASPVYFVAHSMGGLVVRTWIRNHPASWSKDRRLIMLGTPNHGSFSIPQVITGAHKMVRKLATVDIRHNLSDFTKILNTFPGSYQMLPSPLVMEHMEPLYRAETWPGRGVSQTLLDGALKHHDALAKVIDRERMIYIAGTGHLTASDFRDWSAMDRLDGYVFTPAGDETVPHKLGFLSDDSGRIPTRFTQANHGEMPNDPGVVKAVLEYISTGKMTGLEEKLDAVRSGATRGREAVLAVKTQWDLEVAAFAAQAPVAAARSLTRKQAATKVAQETNLLSGFLDDEEIGSGSRGLKRPAPLKPDRQSDGETDDARKNPGGRTIEVAIHLERIENVQPKGIPGAATPVDFLAVGHYQGVEPQWAEFSLDVRLSKELKLIGESDDIAKSEIKDRLFITEATRRGSVTMRLGEPYVLPLPKSRMHIALAGLGLPGTFGRAELRIMIKEFTTTLAKLGCKHLGTVVIGSGDDNMDVATVARVWLENLRSLAESGLEVIPRITFLVISARRAIELDAEFREIIENNSASWGDTVKHLGITLSEKELRAEIAKETKADERRKSARKNVRNDPSPSFINVARIRGGYEFSAVTQDASVPLRSIRVDPTILDNISNLLAENGDFHDQKNWGTLLEKLLIPRDLRAKLFTSAAPVVFTLDAASARIPWEMLRRPSTLPEPEVPHTSKERAFDPEDFLGTANGCGVTRQLRTTFAPAAELSRGDQRHYSFLVIADPAEDASLGGALDEAFAIGSILERLKRELQESNSEVKITIKTLIGPSEATREEVLLQLTVNEYDAVHFAGHCYFDKEDPTESGWIFHEGRNERITAAELARLDHVPPFVFSNACESGITPDRSEGSSAGLAPAFAEAFFAGGVRNFICTAWPVGDEAALIFATVFYEALLGLNKEFGSRPATIREAMLLARRATAASADGLATWGAYQHYGNPSFRFL